MKDDLIRISVCRSTMDEAALLVRKGKAAPFGLIADEQTAGRGQFGKTWEAKKGDLMMTIALAIKDVREPMLLSLTAGVSVAECLKERGLEAALKWPNDVLFDGVKISGILVEEKEGFFFVGLGLDLAPRSAGEGDSVSNRTKRPEDRDLWADRIFKKILRYKNETADVILERYGAFALPERTVRFRENDEIREGRTSGLTNDGALRLVMADGTMKFLRSSGAIVK